MYGRVQWEPAPRTTANDHDDGRDPPSVNACDLPEEGCVDDGDNDRVAVHGRDPSILDPYSPPLHVAEMVVGARSRNPLVVLLVVHVRGFRAVGSHFPLLDHHSIPERREGGVNYLQRDRVWDPEGRG